MDGKTMDVRIQATSSYFENTCLNRIEIDIPISYDHENDSVRNQIYQSWEERHMLPENFKTANWFLSQVGQFAKVSQISLGKSLTYGTYVALHISQRDAMGYTISCIEKLLLSGKSRI